MLLKSILLLVVFLTTLALSFLGGMYLFDDFDFVFIAITFVVSAIQALLATLGTIELIIIVEDALLDKKSLTPATPSQQWHLQ